MVRLVALVAALPALAAGVSVRQAGTETQPAAGSPPPSSPAPPATSPSASAPAPAVSPASEPAAPPPPPASSATAPAASPEAKPAPAGNVTLVSSPPPNSTLTAVSNDPAECASCPGGATTGGKCYTSLAEAIGNSTMQGTVTVNGEHKVAAPIHFGNDLTIQGLTCGGKRPKLIGTFADPTQGILNLDITMYNGNATYIGYYETDVDFSMYSMPQPGGFDYIQVVKISGIDFAPDYPNSPKTLWDTDSWPYADDLHIQTMQSQPSVTRNCGVRGPDVDTQFTNGTIDLTIDDCSFTNFLCKKNGSAIYVYQPEAFSVDAKSVFTDNMVYDTAEVYGGGGAIYLGYTPSGTTVQIQGAFNRNKVFFPYRNDLEPGSEHGEGGAIKFDWVAGNVNISANFTENMAPDGAAVQIMELQSDEAEKGAWVHGYFKGNKALDFGAGSRGACLRVLDANASIHLSGVFEDNISNERGAVFAANWINNRSVVTVSGSFNNNTSQDRGTIVSAISDYHGRVVLKMSAQFTGNSVKNVTNDPEQRTDILWISKEKARMGEDLWYKDYFMQEDFVVQGPPGIAWGALANQGIDVAALKNQTAAANNAAASVGDGDGEIAGGFGGGGGGADAGTTTDAAAGTDSTDAAVGTDSTDSVTSTATTDGASATETSVGEGGGPAETDTTTTDVPTDTPRAKAAVISGGSFGSRRRDNKRSWLF